MVQVQSGSSLNHAVGVGTSTGLLIHSDQPEQLRLCALAFWVSAGGGQGGSRVISACCVVKMYVEKWN